MTTQGDSPAISDESLASFISITGASRDAALGYLEACAGNVQTAVGMYFDASSPSVPAGPSRVPADTASYPSSSARVPAHPASERAPIPQRIERLNDMSDVWQASAAFVSLQGGAHASFYETISQTADSNARARRLEQMFRPPVDLSHPGTFDQAMDRGARLNRWLIVNVQNNVEFACQALNRDVWNDAAVRELVSRRFVLWQVKSESAEGKRFEHLYHVTAWPHVSVVDPRTGEKVCQLDADDLTDARRFCDFAAAFLLGNETPESDEENGTTPASLPDVANLIINEVEEEEVIAEEADEMETEEATKEAEEEPESTKERYEDYLGSADDPVTKIVLRLSRGERRVLEWPCSTRLRALELYVLESEGGGGEAGEFEIATNFPRKLVDMSRSKETTLSEAGLHPQQALFVQRL